MEATPSFSAAFLVDDVSERLAAQATARVFDDVRRLGLERNAWELDAEGFTVVPPELVGPTSFIDELRAQVLDVAGRRLGAPIDVETGRAQSEMHSPFGQVQFDHTLLFEDPVFERALLHERTLALITYLLGESCVLNHLSSMVKGPGSEYLPLHTDQQQSGGPAPYPPYAQVANATWALTEYTAAGGAICFVPGSHKLCRPPTRSEATDVGLFEPLAVPAGSIVVWHGNTWHGALPRREAGVRISLVAYFQRWYHRPVFPIDDRVTPEMLDRNPPRFAVLTGIEGPATTQTVPAGLYD